MSKQNLKMTLQGYDTKPSTCDINVDQPFSDVSGKHYGMPITSCAALEMITRFRTQNPPTAENPFRDVLWVEFSKASIFRILAQEDTEYVRFYMCIPDAAELKASLTLEGIDANGDPVKKGIVLDIAKEMDKQTRTNGRLDESSIYKMLDDLPPDYEEKGNASFQLHGPNAVHSMQEFLADKGSSITDDSIFDFANKFYKYAKDKF